MGNYKEETTYRNISQMAQKQQQQQQQYLFAILQ